jgi:hypothetical protein
MSLPDPRAPAALTPADQGQCGHMRVVHYTVPGDRVGLVIGEGWRCSDCSTEFRPAPLPSPRPEQTASGMFWQREDRPVDAGSFVAPSAGAGEAERLRAAAQALCDHESPSGWPWSSDLWMELRAALSALGSEGGPV